MLRVKRKHFHPLFSSSSRDGGERMCICNENMNGTRGTCFILDIDPGKRREFATIGHQSRYPW